MAISRRQSVYLRALFGTLKAVGHLGYETVKATPYVVKAGLTTKRGAAGFGFAAGTFAGYRISRSLQEEARRYMFGGGRPTQY
jgi:hypothetical protein